MSLAVVATIAILTYASRALALVVMTDPPDGVKVILDRIPARLFASLATTSLIEGGDIASPETLCAALLALGATWTRSLLWVLVAGLVGYALGVLTVG